MRPRCSSTGYGNGITGADEFLDPEIVADPALNLTGEYAELAQPVAPCSTTALDLYDRVWTAVTAAASAQARR